MPGTHLAIGVPGGMITFFSPSLYLTSRSWPSLPAAVAATLAMVMVAPGPAVRFRIPVGRSPPADRAGDSPTPNCSQRRASPAIVMRGRRQPPLQEYTGETMSVSFTRREAIGGAALGAGAATLGGMQAIAQTGPRKTFVLIHGAYHGGWCWRKVLDILEKQGHKVYAPSLTGLADRSHLLSMNLTLDTHITDIVNLFKWEDINNGCLAVHSGGGWPGSGALEQIGDRVSSIVWVDAFIPKNGESQLDQISPLSRKALEEAMARARPAASRRRRTSTRSARRTTPG